MAAGAAGGNEFLSLVGRIAIDGVENVINNLGELGTRADNAAQRVGKFGAKMGEAGKKMQDAGASMTTGVTAPLAALGIAAVGVANETEKATGKIQAQLGLTAEQAKVLSDSAQNLWVNGFGDSIEDAAANVALVGQNMQGLNPAQIEEATRQAMIFRDAFGEEVEASTAAAQVMMKNFGLSSTEAFDLMTVGMQKGGNFSGELLDTLREYAPQFKSMGMNSNEMMNTLIAGSQAGAFNLDKVGDAVKEFNVRAADGSKTTATGFAAIGLKADEMGAKIAAGGDSAQTAYQATIAGLAAMKDPVEQRAAGVALFGTQWEDLQTDVVLAMSTTKDQLGEVKGATDAAGDALANNFGARFTTSMRKLGIALQPIGIILMDMAEKVLPVLEQKVEQLSNWFGSLTGQQQKWVVILGLAAAAIGPLLVVMGTMFVQIGAIMTGLAGMSKAVRAAAVAMNLKTNATKLATGAMKLFGGAVRLLGVALRFLALNPIGLAITAITGLVAIGIYVYKNWETLGPKITGIFNSIGEWFKKTWNGTLAFAKTILRVIGAAIIGAFVGYVAAARRNMEAMQTAIQNILRRIETGTRNVLTSIKNFFVNTWTGLVTSITNLANRIKNGIVTAWETTRNKTVEIVGGIKTAFINKVSEMVTEAGKIPGKIGGAISDKVKDATGAMTDLADDLITKFKKALGINSPSKVFYEMAGNIIKGLTNGLSAGNLASLGKSVFSKFAGGALNSLDAIKGFINGGLGKITGKGADKAAGWIKQAMSIAGVSDSWFKPLMQVANKESGFNPGAQNNWDINAKRGIPSKGLFQTIGPTFGAYKMPGLNDIFNPVHNAVAAIRYMQDRYGSVFNLPGIQGLQDGTGYKGYYKGGVFTGPSVVRLAENAHTPVEAAIPLSGRYMYPFADAIGNRIATAGGGNNPEPLRITIEVPVILNGREIARATAPELDTELARRQQRDARARGRRL